MTSSNGNIFRFTGPLCWEFTGPGEFPTQKPVTRSFDVFFALRLNKRLSKQPWGWWFETPSWSLWRQCKVFSSCSWSPVNYGFRLRTHFTKDCSTTIQIWWKYRFALIQIVTHRSLQILHICCHCMCIFCCGLMARILTHQNETFLKFKSLFKNRR